MDSKKAEKLPIEIPSDLSGLFHRYHDTVLADDSLSDMDVVLACIYLMADSKKKAAVSYDECKNLFISLGRKEDNYRKNVSLAKKKSLIRGDENLSLLIGGLKKIRETLGQIGKTPVFIIRSGKNFTAIKLFEEFLTGLNSTNEILLCDSHISEGTLFPFSVLEGKAKSFRILTANVYDSAKFKSYLKKMAKEMKFTIEVKVNDKIHDRYLIAADKCWSIGCSIKDFGNKDTTIKEISEVISSIKDLFQERWDEGVPLV